MNPERYLQACLVATVVLATFLLGLGQQNVILPSLALFAGLTSFYFTDFRGWFRLNRHVANMAALGAVAFATLDFVETDPNTRLLAIANLLVYLQVVLFYQQKNERHYWQLLVLSLLQVVVAAALNLGVEFGLLLATYLVLAMTSLGLLFVHCESRPFATETILTRQTNVDGAAAAVSAASIVQPGGGSQFFTRRDIGSASMIEISASAEAASAMFNRGMIWQIVKLSVATVGLTFVIFFLTPRFGKSTWHESTETDERIVGFTDEISLNDVGTLLEDDTIVMRVHFENHPERTLYKVQGDFYLRGAVLTEYISLAGMWRPASSSRGVPRQRPPPLPRQYDIVRQVIQSGPSNSLFTVTPAYAVDETPSNLRMHPETFQLFQAPENSSSGKGNHLRYVLATNAFRDGWQTTVTPCRTDSRGYEYMRRECLFFDRERCPKLAELTDELIDESGAPRTDPYRVAKTLESHFLRPGNFTYSLSAADRAPADQDSTEFFVTETRIGHCELFASGLALMLRHAGIPARVVVGFRGADLNELGNYYQVKNLHAHAWVEAFMSAKDVPSAEIPRYESAAQGVWLRLDPTPLAGANSGPVRESALVTKVKKLRDYVELLWNDYILGLDHERQKVTIYKPILARTKSFFVDILFSRKWWRTFGTELVEKLGIDSAESFRQRWFNWRAAPILLGVLLLLTASIIFYRRLLARMARWLVSRPAAMSRWAHRITYRRRGVYPRLERVLRRHGVRRAIDQTAMEFASQAALELKRRDVPSELVDVPQAITRAYYRERFGQQPLDASESQAVEHSLFALEMALTRQRSSIRS